MKFRTLLIAAGIVIINSIDILAQDTQNTNKKTYSSPDFPGVLVFDFGFNGLINAPDTMNLGWWKSKSASFYYMRSFPVGRLFTFNPAIGLSLEKYAFADDVTLGYADDNGESVLAVVPINADEVLKTKMAINYIDLPVEFRFYPKGNDRKGSFYLSVGGSVALLLESHTKVKFKENGITKQTKLRDDFRQSNIRYGLQGRIGIGGVNLFYKEYMSNVFKSDGPAGTSNTTSRTIGISFSGF